MNGRDRIDCPGGSVGAPLILQCQLVSKLSKPSCHACITAIHLLIKQGSSNCAASEHPVDREGRLNGNGREGKCMSINGMLWLAVCANCPEGALPMQVL